MKLESAKKVFEIVPDKKITVYGKVMEAGVEATSKQSMAVLWRDEFDMYRHTLNLLLAEIQRWARGDKSVRLGQYPCDTASGGLLIYILREVLGEQVPDIKDKVDEMLELLTTSDPSAIEQVRVMLRGLLFDWSKGMQHKIGEVTRKNSRDYPNQRVVRDKEG